MRWGKEFNYSAINNFAAAHAKGEYLLFLNNDVKSINPDWLEEMLGVCQRPEDKVNTYTVQYTPTQFVYYNAFAISHIKIFASTTNRNKYEQNIRLVGVEVTPAE